MTRGDQNNERKDSLIGVGLALGIGASLISILYFDNTLGAVICFAIVISLSIGLIVDESERRPIFTLLGTTLGIVAGLTIRLLLNKNGFDSNLVLNTALGAVIGMIVGTIIETRSVPSNKSTPTTCVDEVNHNPEISSGVTK
jgi:hypothetical protein